MSYRLIIAEKPSVANSIAKIIGATTPHKDGPCGYLEGRGYKVTWAFGHLVGLMTPSQMGLTKENLPVFPSAWSTKVLGKKGKTGKEEPDPMVNKQMKTLDTLFKGASEIIVATDAGREGELIFRYIYEHLGCTTPFSRLWISSLTDEAIRNGMNNLKDGHEYDNLSAAAHARSQADWLVGFNASMALSAFSGFKGVVSLGRVQTPTLGMICQRYEDNKSFVPVPYWMLEVATAKAGVRFNVTSEKKYEVETVADFEEDSEVATATMEGAKIYVKGVNWWTEELMDFAGRSAYDTHALRLRWNDTATVTIQLPVTDMADMALTFDICDMDIAAVEEGEYDLLEATVTLIDAGGNKATAKLSDHALIYPVLLVKTDKLDFLFDTPTAKEAFATVSIPVDEFIVEEGQIDLSHIRQIKLTFDDGGGQIALDNIGITPA